MKHKVMIVEDDERYSAPLIAELNAHPLFEVVALTENSYDGWELIKETSPHVLILDLQLAEGHGFDLLKKVRHNTDEIKHQPHILVVTSFSASVTQQKVREYADFVMIKTVNHQASDIVSYLEFMEDEFYNNNTEQTNPVLQPQAATFEHPQPQMDLRARIDKELEEYAIKHSVQGREYLIEAIYQVIQKPNDQTFMIGELYEELTEKFDKSADSINSAIKRTLKAAFENTDRQHFEKVYTPFSNKLSKSAPGNKEFIIYTAKKIKAERNL